MIAVITKIFGFLIAVALIVYTYFKWSFQYWQRRGVPFLKPRIPFGNVENIFAIKRASGVVARDNYNELKRKGVKFGGIYTMATPMLMVIDPELVRNVMAKDFSVFRERCFYYNEKVNPLSANIFAVGGSRWKFLRTKLTPTFTSGKMKPMFHTIADCTETLVKAVEKQADGQTPIHIKDMLACFTTDIIGSCAFGLECNSFVDENAEFRNKGREIFDVGYRELFRTFITSSYPELARKLNVDSFGGEIKDFLLNVVKSNYDYRIKNNFFRNDFFQLLINIKKECEVTGEKFAIEDVAAQCFVFFIAGFETSSTATTFAFYELAKNVDIQNKARNEVREVLKRHDGKITYEAVQEMKYLRCVLDETLRKYPPLPFLDRRCTEAYKIPETDITIEKGTTVLIPVLGLHYDEDYFPEPNKFDPDRFNEKNIRNIKPYTYLPFGDGPRNCLGLRFGVVQSKVGLAALLNNFEFTLNSKTKMPLRFNPNSFILMTDGEMWLSAKRI